MITRHYRDHCSDLMRKSKYRTLPSTFSDTHKAWIDFSSNDYLQLSKHTKLKAAAQNAAIKYGIGATGSRLLSGHSETFELLEKQIASSKRTETSLIFNSGYQANSTVLAALLNSNVLQAQPIVFVDKLCHASIYHGCLFAKAEISRYRHIDMESLKMKLAEYRHDTRPKFIISETVFGMDGDVVDLGTLAQLAIEHQAFLYLDEAHAMGMIGHHGYGLSTLHDLSQVEHLIMGTFSKAIGAFGAYISCSSALKEYLVNTCGGFIYSTALPPMIVATVSEAWSIVAQMNEVRSKILQKAQHLRQKLKDFNIGRSTTHIIPIIIGDEGLTIQVCNKLKNVGIIVSAVRPPSVPPKTARLRLALNASHTEEQIDEFVRRLGDFYAGA